MSQQYFGEVVSRDDVEYLQVSGYLKRLLGVDGSNGVSSWIASFIENEKGGWFVNEPSRRK